MWPTHLIVLLLLCACMSFGTCKFFDIKQVISEHPEAHEYAKIARYLVHKSNWTAMGTVSSLKNVRGYPMVNVKSVADSAVNARSTGHIYFLLTDLDLTGRDLKINNKLTALFTDEQDLFCSSQNIDPIDPICARAIFVGKLRKLNPESDEHEQVNEWFISRHPATKFWPENHGFYYCELEIELITVISFYGGAQTISVEDYFNANYDWDSNDIDNFIK